MRYPVHFWRIFFFSQISLFYRPFSLHMCFTVYRPIHYIFVFSQLVWLTPCTARFARLVFSPRAHFHPRGFVFWNKNVSRFSLIIGWVDIQCIFGLLSSTLFKCKHWQQNSIEKCYALLVCGTQHFVGLSGKDSLWDFQAWKVFETSG